MAKPWNGIECERRRWQDGRQIRESTVHSAPYCYLVTRGSLVFTAGERRHVFTPGMLAWWATGVTFRPSAGETGSAEALVVRLRRRAFAPAVQADIEAWDWCRNLDQCARAQGPLLPVSAQTINELRAQAEALEVVWRSVEPHRSLRLKAGGLHFLATLATDAELHAAIGERLGPADRLIQDLLDWMEDHLADPLTVAGLARRAGLSRSRLCERFTAEVGRSVANHLRHLRVARACELLRQGDTDILSIGYAAGFGSPARFHAAFKRITGTTPARWRRL